MKKIPELFIQLNNFIYCQPTFNYELDRSHNYDIYKSHYVIDSLNKSQNLLAQTYGFSNWHELQQKIAPTTTDSTQNKINVLEQISIKTKEYKIPEFVPVKSLNNPVELGKTNGLFKNKVIVKGQKIVCFANEQEGFVPVLLPFMHAMHNEMGYIQVHEKNKIFLEYIFEIAVHFKREKDIYAIYNNKKFTGRASDNFNPIETWLISPKSIQDYFSPRVSDLIYSFIKRDKDEGKIMSISSIRALLCLPHILSIAQGHSDRKELAVKLLTSVKIPINKAITELNADEIGRYSSFIYDDWMACCDLESWVNEGFISDSPTINLMHIFARKKILLASAPFHQPNKYNKLFNSLINANDRLQTVPNTQLLFEGKSTISDIECSINNYWVTTSPTKENIDKIEQFDTVIFGKIYNKYKYLNGKDFENKIITSCWDYDDFSHILKMLKKNSTFTKNPENCVFVWDIEGKTIHFSKPRSMLEQLHSTQIERVRQINLLIHTGGKYEL